MSSRFNQDDCEEHFGKHRTLGRRNDNPSLYQYGYQETLLRRIETSLQYTGNTEGGHSKKSFNPWVDVKTEPLKKKQKAKKRKVAEDADADFNIFT